MTEQEFKDLKEGDIVAPVDASCWIHLTEFSVYRVHGTERSKFIISDRYQEIYLNSNLISGKCYRMMKVVKVVK
jgi:hypothetical protein